MKNLVVCGDSFSVGIGCHDLHNEPYGSLLAKKLGLNLINLAKGSSTNLSISLQVKHAVDNIPDIELLIVGNTCYHRTEWFPEHAREDREANNLNVNYHQYPPYGEGTYPYLLEHPMKDDSRYRGEMLTENWYGVIDYVENILDKHNNVNESKKLTLDNFVVKHTPPKENIAFPEQKKINLSEPSLKIKGIKPKKIKKENIDNL